MNTVSGSCLLGVGAGLGGHLGLDAASDVRAGVLSQMIFPVESWK